MKKRKIALAIAAFVCSATACIAIAGCTHTHDFSELKHDETTHWYECSCGEKQTAEEHKGGTATCTEKAECEICHEEYGGVLGHNYGEVAYVWNGDKCTATKECANNSAHKITQTLTGTYVKDTDATCTANEKGHYEVTFTTEGLGAASTKANSVEKPDSKHHTLDTTEESIEWNWSADCTSATATVGCTDCDHTEDFTAVVALESSTETCTEPGTVTYKATITVGDKTISNEKTVDANALGHNLKWDTSNTDKDVGTCQREGCTYTVEFNKKVTATNQDLLMTDTTISIDLRGISDYKSVEGIKLTANDVEYDLGKNITALNVTELKKAPQAHGVQTIVVTVKDSNDGVHAVNVPVLIITKELKTADDLKALKPTGSVTVYGYYTLGTNIDCRDIATIGEWKWDNLFSGTLDGKGNKITTAANGCWGIFHELMDATIKNVTFECIYRGDAGSNIFGRAVRNTTFDNVIIIATKDSANKDCSANHRGWLAEQHFNGNTLKDVKIYDYNGNGSLFGTNFRSNTFSNVNIYGTYTELGYDNSTSITTAPEGVTVQAYQAP